MSSQSPFQRISFLLPVAFILLSMAQPQISGGPPSERDYLPPNPIAESDYAQFQRFDVERGIRLLTTGTFHGEDVGEDAASKDWKGLFFTEGRSSLKAVVPVFQKVQDPVLDEAGQTTAVKIGVPESENMVAMISGLPGKSGKPAAYTVKQKDGSDAVFPLSLPPGASLSLQNGYVIKAYGKGWSQYVLEISSTTTDQYAQFFAGAYSFDDAEMSILWIGDINGDNQPDILMNISNKYSYTHLALYLSDANDKRIVVPAASFRYTAC